jgi:GWxTD domain-containing protein
MSCSGSGQKIVIDPESKDFYQYAQLIMTKVEKSIFNHLPDKEAREEFIEDFWVKRDPDPSTDENEFKDEFFRRIEYANKRFREGPPGWKTDRGRIYIYLGPPDKFEEIFTHNEYDMNGVKIRGPILIWVYYRYDLIIQFLDVDGNGKFTFDPMYGLIGSLNEAIEMARLGFSFQDGGMSLRFLDFDVKYDAEKKEIAVSLPVKGINFLVEEGLLKSDFEFEFHVYEKEGPWRDKFSESRAFAKPEDELLEMKKIIFTFSYDLKPGKYYFDVVIISEESIDKTRKVFEIKV